MTSLFSISESESLLIEDSTVLSSFFYQRKDLRQNLDNPLVILSEVLKDTHFGFYDNDILLSHYPEGLVTESMILLPVENFKSLQEQYSYIPESYSYTKKAPTLINRWSNWGSSLAFPLIKSLELKLSINLSEEEKSSLLKKIGRNLPADYIDSDLTISSPFNLNLVSTTNQELFNLLKEENLSILPKIENMIASHEESNIAFKQWLSIQPNLFEDLPSVKKSINDFSIKPLESINYEIIKEKIVDNFDFKSSTFTSLIKFVQIINKIREEYNHDDLLFIKKSKEDLFPLLAQSEQKVFDITLLYIKEFTFSHLYIKDSKVNYLEIIENFSSELYPFCNEKQRTSLIYLMTDFNIISQLRFKNDQKILEKKLSEKNTITPKL